MNKQKGFTAVEALLVLVIIGLITFVGWYVRDVKNKTDKNLDNAANTASTEKIKQVAAGIKTQPAVSTPTAASSLAQTSTKSNKKTSPPTPAPKPAPLNCLPQNPNVYQTYYTNMTNSQYLQSNAYVSTTKILAGLQFAGWINTINTKQYVVLAMSDSNWDDLTPTQLAWMNASPSNMRSVLGWQVVTSCITWNGVNPVEDMAAGSTRTVNTLNGPVTFTSRAGGLGTFGSATVGIWDWFTSNGSVTIAGFVSPPQVP